MVDYVDRSVPVLAKMFDKRIKGYQAIGYSVNDHTQTEREKQDDVGQSDISPVTDQGNVSCPARWKQEPLFKPEDMGK